MRLPQADRIFLLACIQGVLALSLLQDDVHAQEHALMTKIPAMEFSMVFEQALSNAPELASIAIRNQQADTYTSANNSWFAGRSRWDLSYLDDGTLDNIGQREIGTGLQVGLWRPGEKKQAQRLGQAYGQQAQAWHDYLEYSITGRVKVLLADIQEAERLSELEVQARQNAEQLLQITQSLFESGSLAEIDVIQAEALLIEHRRAEMNSFAQLHETEMLYRMLTGLEVRPAAVYSESLRITESTADQHPLIHYLRTTVELANEEIVRVRREARSSPSLRVGLQRERGARQTPNNDSVAVSLNIPLGGKSWVATKVVDARRDKVDRDIELQQALRNLQRQLQELNHQLEITQNTLALTQEQMGLTQRRWAMAQTAFETGEISLVEVVRAQQMAQSTEKEYESLLLRQQRLYIELNQTLGARP